VAEHDGGGVVSGDYVAEEIAGDLGLGEGHVSAAGLGGALLANF